MRQLNAILLLLVFGLSILPWQIMCTAHPFGHDHSHHDGPSVCDMHRMAAQQEGLQLLPPMDCDHITSIVDDYTPGQTEKLVPSIQLLAIAVVFFDLVKFEVPLQPFTAPPDPKCRSATLLSDGPLRAPPLV